VSQGNASQALRESLRLTLTKDCLTLNRDQCKCGCGLGKSGRGRYHTGHKAFQVRCRQRWNMLRSYAKKKSLPFTITLNDVKRLLYPLDDFGESFAISRMDYTRGFEPDNLIVKRSKKALQKNVETASAARAKRHYDRDQVVAMLWDCAKRAFEAGTFGDRMPFTVDDLVDQYYKQDGRCEASYGPLTLEHRTKPRSVRISRADSDKPWAPDNLILICRGVHSLVTVYGPDVFVEIAQGVIKKQKQKDKKHGQAPPETTHTR